jgi:serine phosphatase RsbU (regulator of sigma subunit)
VERGGWSHLLSWLLVPAAALLLASTLSLPRKAYTGLVVFGDVVQDVVAGSPGDRAGVRPGDRIVRGRPSPLAAAALDPLAGAAPGRPLTLSITRDGRPRRAWLTPEPLPPGDWSMAVGLLLVGAGSVLLGAWVWSERRDTLTRVFLLLCLSFATLLVPPPLWTDARAAVAFDLVYTLAQLMLPALFVHLFAVFPEARGPAGRTASFVSAAYGVSLILFAASVATFVVRLTRPGTEQPAIVLLSAVASAWFVLGVLFALALFVRSFARAGSPDARRRLRVVLAGTVLGVGPLATLIALHNLAPWVTAPGERWTVLLTLLVPGSFAWAIAVHRIFDFRVALRAGAGALLVIAVAVAAWFAGEGLARRVWPAGAGGLAGATFAFLTAAVGVAPPVRRGLRALTGGEGVDRTLAAWTGRLHAGPSGPDEILASSCEALRGALRLDGCAALVPVRSGMLVAAGAGNSPGAPLPRMPEELVAGRVVAVEQASLDAAERTALERAGARWILPVGESPPAALFVLGRRLAGAWLDLEEVAELQRFAGRIEMALENAALRRDVSTHGRLDRSLREAGAIQAHRLPRHAPVLPTLDCAAASLSSEPVGGDYYDFVQGASRDFTLAVGDAAGKGVPAALVMADVQSRFRNEARRGLSPGEVLASLNHELVREGEPEHFVGLLCARVEAREGRVWLANAGLTPPLLRRRDGTFEEVTAGGVLLGVREGADYPDVGVALGSGDVLLLHTDGLTEACRGEEMFGTERVRRVLDVHAHRRAADIVQALIDEVRTFADTPLDDLTVVVLRQLTDPPPRAAPPPPLKSGTPSADTDR